MTSNVPAGADWSPADHPYAIAVSEAMWWRCAVQLAVARLGDPDDRRSALVSSKRVDARNMVFALVQLLAAKRLEQTALRDLRVDSAIGEALSNARDRHLAALPDIQEIRNVLTHFDGWAIGQGRGAQWKGHRERLGEARRRWRVLEFWLLSGREGGEARAS